MSYTQVWDNINSRIADTVVRDEDGAWIPFDDGNADYRDYLAWLDEGNTPNPSPYAPTKEQT